MIKYFVSFIFANVIIEILRQTLNLQEDWMKIWILISCGARLRDLDFRLIYSIENSHYYATSHEVVATETDISHQISLKNVLGSLLMFLKEKFEK